MVIAKLWKNDNLENRVATSVLQIQKYLKLDRQNAKTPHGGPVSRILALIWPGGPGEALVKYINR